MTLANAIIAGVNKAGTTSLFNALAGHEQVSAARVKETHFFDRLKYGEELPGLDEYAAFFEEGQAAPVVLEATPGYFYGGARVAREINRLLPDVRLVVILREPGARAHSWWRFCRSRLLLDRAIPFSEYLARCAAMGEEPESSPRLVGWRGLSGGMYSRCLPAWQDTFQERLFIGFYDDLQTDPEATLAQVCEHLGIAALAPGAWRRDNVTTDVANPLLQRLALRANHRLDRFWRAAPGVKAAVRSTYYRVNAASSQERLSRTDRRWLTDYYADELTRLAAILPPQAPRPAWLRVGAA